MVHGGCINKCCDFIVDQKTNRKYLVKIYSIKKIGGFFVCYLFHVFMLSYNYLEYISCVWICVKKNPENKIFKFT